MLANIDLKRSNEIIENLIILFTDLCDLFFSNYLRLKKNKNQRSCLSQVQIYASFFYYN
jgi:hypothetical protein